MPVLRGALVEPVGFAADPLLELLQQRGRRRLRQPTPGEDRYQVVGSHLAQELGVFGGRDGCFDLKEPAYLRGWRRIFTSSVPLRAIGVAEVVSIS